MDIDARDQRSASMDDQEFQGAVGLFDAPQDRDVSLLALRKGSHGKETGAKGFFDFLDDSGKAVLGLKQQKSVTFDGSKEGPSLPALPDLEGILEENPEMEELILRAVKLKMTSLQILSAAFLGLHALTRVDLSFNALGILGLEVLVDSLGGAVNLRHLCLSSIGLGSVTTEQHVILCEPLLSFPLLRVLDLSRNGLSFEALQALATAVIEHRTVTDLRIDGNLSCMTPHQALQLLSLLSLSFSLRDLSLSNPEDDSLLKSPGVSKSRSFLHGVTKKFSLGSVGVNKHSPLAEALVHSLSIERLVVWDVWKGKEVEQILRQNCVLNQIFRTSSNVRLDLSGRQLSYIPLRVVQLSHLVELDLSSNLLKTVPDAMGVMKRLKWLSLENNQLQIHALPTHLLNLRKLRYLSLAGNPLAAHLPKNYSPENVKALFAWFRQQMAVSDLPRQVALLVSSTIAGDPHPSFAELVRLDAMRRSNGEGGDFCLKGPGSTNPAECIFFGIDEALTSTRGLRLSGAGVRRKASTPSTDSPEDRRNRSSDVLPKATWVNPSTMRRRGATDMDKKSSKSARKGSVAPPNSSLSSNEASASTSSNVRHSRNQGSDSSEGAKRPSSVGGTSVSSEEPPDRISTSSSMDHLKGLLDDQPDQPLADGPRSNVVMWRVCDIQHVPVWSLFHPLFVLFADVSVAGWEPRLREVLSSTSPRSCNIVAVLNLGASVDRSIFTTKLCDRLARFNVASVHSVNPSDASSLALLLDAIYALAKNALESFPLGPQGLPRALAQTAVSLAISDRSVAPTQLVSLFSTFAHGSQVLRWAQLAGLFSQPIDDHVCTNLSWAHLVMECYENAASGLTVPENILRDVFPRDLFSPSSLEFALKLLQESRLLCNIGWPARQWLFLRPTIHHGPADGSQGRAPATGKRSRGRLPAESASSPRDDLEELVRMYRFDSPLGEGAIYGLIRKMCLQAAGVLSEITQLTETGFCGAMILGDTYHPVVVSVQRETRGLCLVVKISSDPRGHVVQLVCTVVERVLEEDDMQYVRTFLAADGKEGELDALMERFLESSTRKAFDGVLAPALDDAVKAASTPSKVPFSASASAAIAKSSASSDRIVVDVSTVRLLPELHLLVGHRLFWDELQSVKVAGKGAFGEVEVCKVARTGALVAVKKLLKREDQAAAAATREIVREIWVLYRLNHPNVVMPQGVCFNPLALCMEYMEKGDLRRYLDHHPVPPWPHAFSLLMDIAYGMEYAHSLRPPLIHSDLKSPNILLGLSARGTLVAKIADLGLASFSAFNSVALVDNPLWAAPEVIERHPFTPSVDVYSFAIIAWELCTGPLPFMQELEAVGGFMAQLAEAIVRGTRPSLLSCRPGVPGGMLTLISQCWSSDASLRPSFREIVARMGAVADAEEVHLPTGLAENDSTNPSSAPATKRLQSLNRHLTTPVTFLPRKVMHLGDSLIVVSEDGYLWSFDDRTLLFKQRLRWKLSERIRVADCVILNDTAYIVYGLDTLFVLHRNLAAHRVFGFLSGMETVTVVGANVWIGGRLQSNEPAIHVYNPTERSWDGEPIALDTKGSVIEILPVSDSSALCVVSGQDASKVIQLNSAILMGRQDLLLGKSRVVPSRVTAALMLPQDELWLALPSQVLSINLETLETLKVVSMSPIHFLRILVGAGDSTRIFGQDEKGHVCVFDFAGACVFKTEGVLGNNLLECVEVVGELSLVVGASRSQLCSWRFDYLEPMKERTTPRAEAAHEAKTGSAGPRPSILSSLQKSSSAAGLKQSPRSLGGSSGVGRSFPDSMRGSGDHGQRNRLHMTRRAARRANVTVTHTGHIVSCNDGCYDIFGYMPEELVKRSVRDLFLVPRAQQQFGSLLMFSQMQPQTFASTSLWQGLMDDMTRVRIVNGQRKDGGLVPLLISTSEIIVGDYRYYALMFELMNKKCGVLIVDDIGVVTLASDSVSDVVGWSPSQLVGRTVNSFLLQPTPHAFLRQFDYEPNKDIPAVVTTANGQNLDVFLQVIDYYQKVYTIMLRPVSLEEVGNEELKRLNYYTLGSVLGSGMCGEVYAGTHKLTGAQVAIKRLKRIHFERAGLAFTDREVDLLRKMDHPQIAQLLDCIRLENETVLVLELVTGCELFTFCIDNGPLDESLARKLFWDIFSAVQYMHSRGVVHRDLKLENCLMQQDQRIKIIDFGLGNFYGKDPLTTSCGSPNYAAPEMFTARRYRGPPVDVWAMGVILYAMVAGEFPFENSQASIDVNYELPGSLRLSRSFRRVIAGIFVANPDLRLSLEMIRRSEWMQTSHVPPEDPDAKLEKETPLRPDIVVRMEQEYGIPMEIVLKSLKDSEVNHVTGTYRILRNQNPIDDQDRYMESRLGRRAKMEDQVRTIMKKVECDELVTSMAAIVDRRALTTAKPTSSGSSKGLAKKQTEDTFSRKVRTRSRSGVHEPGARSWLGVGEPGPAEAGSLLLGSIGWPAHASPTPLGLAVPSAEMAGDRLPSPTNRDGQRAMLARFGSGRSGTTIDKSRESRDLGRGSNTIGPSAFKVLAKSQVLQQCLCAHSKSGLVYSVRKISRVLSNEALLQVVNMTEVMKRFSLIHSPWVVNLVYTFADPFFLYQAFEVCERGTVNPSSILGMSVSARLRFSAQVGMILGHIHSHGCTLNRLDWSMFGMSGPDDNLRVRLQALEYLESLAPCGSSSPGTLWIRLSPLGPPEEIVVKPGLSVGDIIGLLMWKLRAKVDRVFALRFWTGAAWQLCDRSEILSDLISIHGSCEWELWDEGTSANTLPFRLQQQQQSWRLLGPLISELWTHGSAPVEMMELLGDLSAGKITRRRAFQGSRAFEGIDWTFPTLGEIAPVCDLDLAKFSQFEPHTGPLSVRGDGDTPVAENILLSEWTWSQ